MAKSTGPDAAKSASETLKSESTSEKSKKAAGSALSQVEGSKSTSESAATAASSVLRDGRTSDDSKSAAASSLSQKK